MKRGTTPTHTFNLPCAADMFTKLEIAYFQFGKHVLSKHKEDCEITGEKISVTLTQEDTFLFDDSTSVEIQIRALDPDNKILMSDIYKVDCDRCLFVEVMK